MLPLTLLSTSTGSAILVELKNGETLNGILLNCDTWMNLTLKEVVQTSPDGDKFMSLPEAYVRGNNIKYLRIPDQTVDKVKEQQQQQQNQQGDRRDRDGGGGGGGKYRGQRGDFGGRGDRGGRGRGEHRGGRGRGRGRGM